MNEIDKIVFDGKKMTIYQGNDVISMKANIQDVISLKGQNDILTIGILQTEDAREDIILQLDILFDDFVVSELIRRFSEITQNKTDKSFINLLIYETIKQVPDLTIKSGYKVDCVDKQEYEAIILYTYKKWINRKTESERNTIEKTFINHINKDIRNDIHDLKDLDKFINKRNVKEVAKDKMVDLSISDMIHCYNMIHKNENLIMFMNHEDGIKDFINYFEIDYEDFIELVVGNSFYEPTENYIASDGKNKLFTYDDEFLINDLLNNITTECAKWIIKHY